MFCNVFFHSMMPIQLLWVEKIAVKDTFLWAAITTANHSNVCLINDSPERIIEGHLIISSFIHEVHLHNSSPTISLSWRQLCNRQFCDGVSVGCAASRVSTMDSSTKGNCAFWPHTFCGFLLFLPRFVCPCVQLIQDVVHSVASQQESCGFESQPACNLLRLSFSHLSPTSCSFRCIFPFSVRLLNI